MAAPAPVCARLPAMPAALTAQGFALRPENGADVPFLRRLYVSTRREELAIVTDWSDAQKQAFLESQFGFQRHHYLTYYASADCAILEQDGVPAGRLYIDRQQKTLLVVDISLLPEWRRRGIGTALLQAVIAEARAVGKSATISVEKFNPAQRLYRRLGFREVADEGVHWVMECPTAPEEGAAADQLNIA
jgi:ribosomal protein S18 acetylase RimI-like enzyme